MYAKKQFFALKTSRCSLQEKPSKEGWKLIQMTPGHFPRWRTALSQALSTFQDGDRVKFSTQPGDCCGCQNPYPGRASRSQLPVVHKAVVLEGPELDYCTFHSTFDALQR